MKGILSLKELRGLLTDDKKLTVALIVGAVLILFLSLGGLKSGEAEAADRPYEDRSAYEAELERRLTDILSEIEGIGELSVMVTLDTSEQTEYGKNEDMLLSVKMPQVRGVIVVCGGGDSVIVQEKVVRAVTGVFAVSSTRVSVIK